jgi:hypothetical protein
MMAGNGTDRDGLRPDSAAAARRASQAGTAPARAAERTCRAALGRRCSPPGPYSAPPLSLRSRLRGSPATLTTRCCTTCLPRPDQPDEADEQQHRAGQLTRRGRTAADLRQTAMQTRAERHVSAPASAEQFIFQAVA